MTLIGRPLGLLIARSTASRMSEWVDTAAQGVEIPPGGWFQKGSEVVTSVSQDPQARRVARMIAIGDCLRRSAVTHAAAAVVVTLCVVSQGPSRAQNSPETRATLGGIPGVSVYVDSLAPDMPLRGITRDVLKIKIEGRLREARIPVVRRGLENRFRETPYYMWPSRRSSTGWMGVVCARSVWSWRRQSASSGIPDMSCFVCLRGASAVSVSIQSAGGRN